MRNKKTTVRPSEIAAGSQIAPIKKKIASAGSDLVAACLWRLVCGAIL